MAWSLSTDPTGKTWVLNTGTPLLAQLSGQNAYSITWQTGGAGPGANPVALVTPATPGSARIGRCRPDRTSHSSAAHARARRSRRKQRYGQCHPYDGWEPPDAAADFPITVTVTGGGNPTANPSSFNGVVAPGTNVDVTKDRPYSVTQSAVPSFVTTYSPGCNSAAGVGDGLTVNCVVTNTWQSGTLTVNKVCVPVADPGKFNLRVDGANVTANATCGTGTGPQQYSIGIHTVAETAGTGTILGDYTSVIGGACAANGTVTLAVGDNKVCTITNTFVGGGVGPVESGTFDSRRPALRHEPRARAGRLPSADRRLREQDVLLHLERDQDDPCRGRPRAVDPRCNRTDGSAAYAALRSGQPDAAARLRPLTSQLPTDEIETGCCDGLLLNPPPGDCSAYGGGGSGLPPPLPPPQPCRTVSLSPTVPRSARSARGSTHASGTPRPSA